MDKSMVRALGGAFCVVGSLLQRSGIVTLDEFANLMAIYATVSAESDPEEGLILGAWAAMLRDMTDVVDVGADLH